MKWQKKSKKKLNQKKFKLSPKKPKKKLSTMARTSQLASKHTIDLALVINTYTDGEFVCKDIERWVGLNIDEDRKTEIAKKIIELRKLLHDK